MNPIGNRAEWAKLGKSDLLCAGHMAAETPSNRKAVTALQPWS
jgi:hypothetical protein